MKGEFDFFFLLVEDKGMVDYCRKRGISFYSLFVKDKSKTNFLRIPIFCHMRDQYRFFKKCDQFLNSQKPSKLISSETIPSFPVRVLFEKANLLGIETITLQWCLVSSRRFRISWKQKLLKLRQRYGSFLKGVIMVMYFKTLNIFLSLMFRILRFSKKIPDFKNKSNNAKKIGVFDEYSKEVFIAKGAEPDKISIVGNADFQIIQELRKKVQSDLLFRGQLARKYHLDERKKTILVISTVFYSGHAAVCMTPEEQVGYFRSIIEAIRKIFPEEDANIIFKLHPRDENIYSSYADLGVRVIGPEAQNEELIALSDIYISHPGTTLNFLLRASGVPAIFINFTPLDFLNEFGLKFYGIKHIAKNPEEFLQCLRQLKNNKLPFQYGTENIDRNAAERIINFLAA